MVVGVLDLGVGNVRSVCNMLERLDASYLRVINPAAARRISHLVLPGVGSFDTAMQTLSCVPGFIEELEKRVKVDRIPTLGLCLGMQLLTDGSDEGVHRGLGWVSGWCRKLPSGAKGAKVPHIGWSSGVRHHESLLFRGLEEGARFYFAHSYFVKCQEEEIVTLRASNGVEFDAAFEFENIYGVQFHPEKSHRYGQKIIHNFLESPYG